MLSLIADDREKHVIPYFEKYKPMFPDISYKVDRINVGDYVIMFRNNILFAVERKTWKDLASSIKDKRKKNVEKLLDLRGETGCNIIYLIEGNPCPSPERSYCHIPYKNLQSHLDHLAFRDNIHIVYSRDCEYSARRIFEIAQNYLTIHPSPLLKFKGQEEKEENKEGGEELLKKPFKKNTEYELWCALPYISEKTALVLMNAGCKIKDIFLGKIDEEKIAVLEYPSGIMIGKKRAGKISRITRMDKNSEKYQKLCVKILSVIPGVSRETAKKILDETSFIDLLEGKTEQKRLVSVQKTPKRKIGKKLVYKIWELFEV
jgi:ERCC4-type nuclease